MKTLKYICFAAMLIFLVRPACILAQGTAINATGNAADPSAMLDVNSNQQGILIPRMTEAQRNAIPQPASSLMVYQTDGAQPGFYFNAGTPAAPDWKFLVNSTQHQNNALNYATASGALNAYEVTLYPAPAAYAAGFYVIFRANAANTGAATLNVNGLGAVAIKKQVSVDLAAGDIMNAQVVMVVYDGTNFQMINTPPGSSGAGLSAVNLSNPASWQSPTTNNSVWEDVTTLTYTIPAPGIYHVICSYESQDGSGGTNQQQRLVCGSITGQKAQVGPWETGFQYRTLHNLVSLSAGAVIKLQNYNEWNYCCKNTIRNVMISVVKLD